MSVLKRFAIAAGGLLLIGALAGGGYYVGGRTAGAIATRTAVATPAIEGFDVFYEAWTLVEQDYVGEFPADEVVARGAARGLIGALGDQATALIAPEYAALSRQDSSGYYQGIGASVRQTEEGFVAIAAVYGDSPAEESGIEVGDIILEVDGADVTGRSLYEVVSLVRGPADTTVRLKLGKPATGETVDVEVARREIEIRTAELVLLPEGIAHIRLNEFNAQADTQLRLALQEARDQGAWGVILDLRDDPGGYLDQAVAVADEFLPLGTVLIERGRGDTETVHSSTDGGAAEDLPLVVLINGGSASASEIVAGAIQAHGRGLLIGETSFGKGSVQLPFDLSDGSELRVTIAKWYTPDDVLIQDSGLTPDVVVAPGEGEADAQLQAAVESLLETRQ
ncbi:MAG: S41 family peptidase [Anaerolineae bacterium]